MRKWIGKRLITVPVILFVLLGLTPAPAGAVPVPPPDVASYVIDASYDPETHRITADELATYDNRTEATMTDVVLHMYLNAFRSDETLWMREAGPVHRGFVFDPEAAGWIEIDVVRLADDNGAALAVEPVDDDTTLVRIELPEPVEPGESVTLAMTFTAQLPRVFARTGWADAGEFVMAGQWFPKYGVWEAGAWNAYPFHANSEFYADFGTYDVTLALPAGWVVGTTGVSVGDPEAETDSTTVHTFRAEHVIDFAWSASPHFETLVERAGDVEVEVYHYPDVTSTARRVMAATLQGLNLFGDWYGAYGMGLYPQLTVILVPEGAGGAGGMEYPTLFTVGASGSMGSPACLKLLEAETVHELGHQWFQSVLATNEAEEPWLDEGFTEYSTVRAMNALYDGVSTCGGWTLSYLAMQRLGYAMTPETPMAGRAWELEPYAIATYAKPAVALTTLERRVGDSAMVDFLQTYYERYAFTHPTAADVQVVMAETLGEEIAAWFFDRLVYDSATLDAQVSDVTSDPVTVVREGELCVPVDVLVNGERSLPWPCEEPLALDAEEVSAVEIDPNRVALLDLNLANNGRLEAPHRATWLGFSTRVLRFLQFLLGAGGP